MGLALAVLEVENLEVVVDMAVAAEEVTVEVAEEVMVEAAEEDMVEAAVEDMVEVAVDMEVAVETFIQQL